MTPIPPDRADEVRRSITAAYRLKRRSQLEAMQSEIRDLTATLKSAGGQISDLTTLVKGAGLRLSLLAGQVNVMLLEIHSDETTRFLPVLGEIRPRVAPKSDGA